MQRKTWSHLSTSILLASPRHWKAASRISHYTTATPAFSLSFPFSKHNSFSQPCAALRKSFRKNHLESRVLSLSLAGLPSDKLKEVFCRNSEIASYSSQHIEKHLEFFESLGITCQEFCRILMVYPKVLSLPVEEDLRLAIALLESALGEVLVKCIVLWPQLLGVLPKEQFLEKLNFLLKAGFKKRSIEMAKALSFVLTRRIQDLEANMKALQSLGISHGHACRIVKMQPAIFEQNSGELLRKFDYLLNTLCFCLEDLLKYPSFMTYSLDLRIKPRHKMHSWLKSKGLVRRNFKLDYIMSMSDAQFLRKFVECHADGPGMYREFMRNGK